MSENHNDLSQHPNIQGLTLFKADPGPHEHAVHEHGAYSVIVLTSGAKHFHHQGDTIVVHAFEIAVANPDELHGCGPIDEQPWSHRTWYLDADLMAELAQGLGLPTPVKLCSPAIRDQAIAKALIHAHERCGDEDDLLESQSIALDALSSLIEQHALDNVAVDASLARNADERMRSYENWLANNVSEAVELKQLAELVGVKRNQVIKDFKVVHGVTPGNYFRSIRLRHAKELIRQGMDLAQTSSESGFSDQSHFTRCFKSAFGITPKRFKKLAAESGGRAPL